MLSIMKGCSSMGAIFVLIIGVGVLGITLYGFFHPQLFFNQTDARNTILGILIAADVIIILGAILGIFGIKKGKRCFIFFFQILVIIFFFVFLGFTIAVFLLPQTVFEGDCSTSQNILVVRADEVYRASDNLFCKVCDCSLNNATKNGGSYTPEQIQYIDDNYKNSSIYNINQTAASSFGQCEVADKSPDRLAMYEVLNQIQRNFQCSGWCQKDRNLIYTMSDVNNGKPTSYCYYSMKDAITKYGQIIGYSLAVVSFFLFLICTCNICLCCHPELKNRPFSHRFVYYEDRHYQPISR